MAAGFALGAAARDGRHRAAPATDVQVLNIYNWADYVAYNTARAMKLPVDIHRHCFRHSVGAMWGVPQHCTQVADGKLLE